VVPMLATIAAISVMEAEQSHTVCRRPGKASPPATAQQATVIQTPCRHSAKYNGLQGTFASGAQDPTIHGCFLYLRNIQVTIEKVKVA